MSEINLLRSLPMSKRNLKARESAKTQNTSEYHENMVKNISMVLGSMDMVDIDTMGGGNLLLKI